MEIRLGTIIDSQLAAAVLNRSEGMDSVTAYRIMKNAKAISDECETYEKQRIKLCEKYAEKDAEGNPIIDEEKKSYVFSDENGAKLEKEVEALQNEVVEIKIRKVPLETISPAKLTPGLIGTIEFMLEVPEEE